MCVEAFERAFLARVTSARRKARRASVASRHFDVNALFGERANAADPAPAPSAAAAAAASPPTPV